MAYTPHSGDPVLLDFLRDMYLLFINLLFSARESIYVVFILRLGGLIVHDFFLIPSTSSLAVERLIYPILFQLEFYTKEFPWVGDGHAYPVNVSQAVKAEHQKITCLLEALRFICVDPAKEIYYIHVLTLTCWRYNRQMVVRVDNYNA